MPKETPLAPKKSATVPKNGAITPKKSLAAPKKSTATPHPELPVGAANTDFDVQKPPRSLIQHRRSLLQPESRSMIGGTNRQLVTDEPVEGSSRLLQEIMDHPRGIYGIHNKPIKEKRRMSKCYPLELQTPVLMSKNLPEVCYIDEVYSTAEVFIWADPVAKCPHRRSSLGTGSN